MRIFVRLFWDLLGGNLFKCILAMDHAEVKQYLAPNQLAVSVFCGAKVMIKIIR